MVISNKYFKKMCTMLSHKMTKTFNFPYQHNQQTVISVDIVV